MSEFIWRLEQFWFLFRLSSHTGGGGESEWTCSFEGKEQCASSTLITLAPPSTFPTLILSHSALGHLRSRDKGQGYKTPFILFFLLLFFIVINKASKHPLLLSCKLDHPILCVMLSSCCPSLAFVPLYRINWGTATAAAITTTTTTTTTTRHHHHHHHHHQQQQSGNTKKKKKKAKTTNLNLGSA